ncbi:NAD(P)-dependent oxidoreductase [Chitinasiproducens palmae]|uniref:D-3-phosphoglycerate dehydrogenase n=1 Tax=Chitinasiproducens palmae TaxID=1770053 RepID=A0A1H2PQ62_9BURK|nr:NAD(P)-dependent oxidoreductase [Chitinasiproducens palmae]SDV48959.1 D-3-phosphoglycerate dehydrogenase [Chitinasiproducens palmae]
MTQNPKVAGMKVALCDDPVLTGLFDALADALSARGVIVQRGGLPTRARAGSADAGRDSDASAEVGPETVDVAVVSSRARCPAEWMARASRLRAIVAPTIGTETIDIAAATAHGVLVANGATEANVVSMAEATVMLILMSLYHPERAEAVMRGERPRPGGLGGGSLPSQSQPQLHPHPHPYWARTLAGRSVGLIGFGRIGQAVAARLAPFGIRLLVAAHRRVRADHLPTGAEIVPVDSLLAESDVISLHARAEAGQAPLLDAAAFARIKPGAVLINTARGTLVDETALHAALLEGRLAHAALDTFVNEPLPADSPLRGLDNVLLTPHLVGHTQQMFASFLPTALDNILAALAGVAPPHCCNPAVLPDWRQRFGSDADT